ncbi:MAG: hypothetical protein HY263_03975 [Chloroflexi bacterium]|nr:hypothetical protein [Chloroflexota bacterium]
MPTIDRGSGPRPGPSAQPRAAAFAPQPQQPVALLLGLGHKVVHANPAFVAEFGIIPIGVPAAEALLDLPPLVLEVADRVLASGRPLATWVTVRGVRRRLTVAPRTDVETGEVYGVAIRLAGE